VKPFADGNRIREPLQPAAMDAGNGLRKQPRLATAGKQDRQMHWQPASKWFTIYPVFSPVRQSDHAG
jgi:hypothetical protein